MLTLKATIGITAFVLMLGVQPALARKANNKPQKQFQSIHITMKKVVKRKHRHKTSAAYVDPRPSRWCGWWLRQKKGVKDRAYNLAQNWAKLGHPAPGPAPGVVAVWRHHVGEVRDVRPGQILLLSGNDGHAVRERWRSVRGVIAWRWV